MSLSENNKKKFISKPQTIKIIYPPGLGDATLNEITCILENLWSAKPFTGNILSLKTDIRIQGIYLFAVLELLIRSRCSSDIRLIIHSEVVTGKKTFEKVCRSIAWSSYCSNAMSLRIKVNSVSSQAFHEGALKDILSTVLTSQGVNMASDEGADACIYADLYKDKLILSISLAGDPLYKRGYRETLSSSAPLREDFAASCIRKALLFSKKINPAFTAKTIIIPFSGTGTFAFEYLLEYFHIPQICFEREYAIEKMPFFKKEHFNQIKQKALESCTLTSSTCNDVAIQCVDNAEKAMQSLDNNLQRFNQCLTKHDFPTISITTNRDDFFKTTYGVKDDVLIMLNPPYGIRLAKHADSVDLYKKIAKKLNEIGENSNHLAGFILCPSEETWSVFCNHIKQAKIETYHFTQGGLDIRVCQFYTGLLG